MFNVLVTGCGGDIGQSVCKILQSYAPIQRIIGCDIHENHPGKFLCDVFHVVPPCTSDGYLIALTHLIVKESIDFVIPTSEPELRKLCGMKISDAVGGVPLIMPSLKALEVGFDKLKTVDFLKSCALPYPRTSVIRDVATPELPGILKSRNGSGSKNIIKICDSMDFDYYKVKHPDFIFQQYLPDDRGEYTCGLYRTKSGEVRSVTFSRTLAGGFSNYGVVEENDLIVQLLEKIAIKLDLVGSINVQLRMTREGPMVFEINPRFSSTVLFRHLLGFKDLIWCIENSLDMPISPFLRVNPGRKFYKGYQEYYE